MKPNIRAIVESFVPFLASLLFLCAIVILGCTSINTPLAFNPWRPMASNEVQAMLAQRTAKLIPDWPPAIFKMMAPSAFTPVEEIPMVSSELMAIEPAAIFQPPIETNFCTLLIDNNAVWVVTSNIFPAFILRASSDLIHWSNIISYPQGTTNVRQGFSSTGASSRFFTTVKP